MFSKDFKAFILRGNVVDLAVGLIIGASFGAIVKSLVDDVLMPPLGLLIGGLDFSQLHIVLKAPPGGGTFASVGEMVKAGGVALRYGMFINTIVSFLIIAAAVFTVVQLFHRLMKKEEAKPPPATRECPQCLMDVPEKATRCGHCTSAIG